jgi:hypothetical protein
MATAGWYQDPAYTDKQRYWDGRRWTDHRRDPVDEPPPSVAPTPPVAPPVATAAVAHQPFASPSIASVAPPATRRVDNTLAWTLAFAPLIGLLIAVAAYSAGIELGSTGVFWTYVLLNSGLALVDVNLLHRAGVKGAGGGLVLAALFLVPLYLIIRAVKVPRTTAIPIVWCVTFLISLIIPL